MSSTLRTCLGRGAATLLLLALASHADAGGDVFTAQQLSFSLKTVSQTSTNSGDQKPSRHTGNASNVFEQCLGSATPPTKTQGIYLFLDCTALNLGTDPVVGTILALDTQALPPTSLADVGTLTVHTASSVVTTKNGTPTAAIVPVEIAIDCNASTTTASFVGVMTMKLSPLGLDVCPDSGVIRLLGGGSTVDLMSLNPIDFLADSGSSIGIKKRSTTITAVP